MLFSIFWLKADASNASKTVIWQKLERTVKAVKAIKTV